ncbi:glycine betaine ABC transporter substrate-binding protein [uncultured Jatrophihabitans sp.]|uniref:ABC transporter substrate-binding protein n=1 Tax=uncultured Jatrophihabitans sp. TaxID=1610747 RepID=UPI0035CA3399
MNKRRALNRIAAVGAGLALATTMAACGSSGSSSKASGSSATSGSGTPAASTDYLKTQPGKGKPAFILGDKNFAEQYLLGALYQQALQAAGYTVTLKGNLGSSEIADKALQSGKIDGIPEYTGVIYTELAKLGDTPKSAAETLAGATKYETGRGFAVLKPTPFQDADGFAVLKSYADKNGLKTIDDMSKVGAFSYGGPPENATRFQGVLGLKKAYGLNKIQFKPLTIGTQYQAIDQGKINSIAIFTTDGQLAGGKYTVLTDTKGIFGFQNIVPVINKEKLAAEGPAFTAICNKVSALLTTPAIIALNKAVQIDQKEPAVVAKAFLQANGLVAK